MQPSGPSCRFLPGPVSQEHHHDIWGWIFLCWGRGALLCIVRRVAASLLLDARWPLPPAEPQMYLDLDECTPGSKNSSWLRNHCSRQIKQLTFTETQKVFNKKHDLHKNVYSISIHNCPKLGTTQISFNREMDKQAAGGPYHGCHSVLGRISLDTLGLDDFQRHLAEWKKSERLHTVWLHV